MTKTREEAIEKLNTVYVTEFEKLAEIIEENLYTLDPEDAPVKQCRDTGSWEYSSSWDANAFEEGASAFEKFKKLLDQMERDEDFVDPDSEIGDVRPEWDEVFSKWDDKRWKEYGGFDD